MSSLLTTPNVLILATILAVIGFFLGRSRALAAVDGDQRALHSRPKQHGWHVALATFVPAFVFLILWAFLSGLLANFYAEAIIPDDEPEVQLPASQRAGLTDREIEIREEVRLGLLINNVKALAVAIDGYIDGGSASEDEVAGWNADFAPLQERLQADGQYVASQVTRGMLRYAQDLRSFRNTMGWAGPLVGLIMVIGGFALCYLLVGSGFPGPDLGRGLEHWDS